MTIYSNSFEGTSPFSDQAYQVNLTAGGAQSVTVPGTKTDQYQAVFSWAYNANVWVGFNTIATLPPAGAVTSTPNIELRPDKRFVRGGDTLSFISTDIAADSAVRLLKLPA